jgi:peroxiredoxin
LNARVQPEPPAPGDPFPPVVGLDCAGQPLELLPNNALVILFRGHWCGHCRSQLVSLAREAQAFAAAGFRLLAVSTDSSAGCTAMRAETGGAIDIVSDPRADFIARLGLTDSDPLVTQRIAQPAVFVIDVDGIVRYRYISRSAEDRPKTALLLLAVERVASDASKLPSQALG